MTENTYKLYCWIPRIQEWLHVRTTYQPNIDLAIVSFSVAGNAMDVIKWRKWAITQDG